MLPGNRCLQNVELFFLRQNVQPCLLKNPKYTFYTIKSSLKLAYYLIQRHVRAGLYILFKCMFLYYLIQRQVRAGLYILLYCQPK